MEKALIYYFNIYIEKINKINNNYYFRYNNDDYIISIYDRDIFEVQEIYNLNLEMINNNFPVFKIIPTKTNNIIFEYEKKLYILMVLPNIKNRIITIDDIIKFIYIPKNKYKLLDKSNWNISWENKIDYIEKQFFQIENKHKIIKESINYFIGIWENGISYYNDNNTNDNGIKMICHKRITCNSDILSFFNPLNLVIDYKERNLADYLKSYIYEKKYSNDKIILLLKKIENNNVNIIRFISRSLFLNEYFDLYEEIVFFNKKEDLLLKVINSKENYELYLKMIFNYFSKYNTPYINWIIKKD